jgi:hypothetical protein
MKPSIHFLRKVRQRQVYILAEYKPKNVRNVVIRGGEVAWEKHAKAGFVTPMQLDLNRCTYAALTELGEVAWANREIDNAVS